MCICVYVHVCNTTFVEEKEREGELCRMPTYMCLCSGATHNQNLLRNHSWKIQFVWKNRNSRFYRLKRLRMTYATVQTWWNGKSFVYYHSAIRLLHFQRNGFFFSVLPDRDCSWCHWIHCYDLNTKHHTMLRCMCLRWRRTTMFTVSISRFNDLLRINICT